MPPVTARVRIADATRHDQGPSDAPTGVRFTAQRSAVGRIQLDRRRREAAKEGRNMENPLHIWDPRDRRVLFGDRDRCVHAVVKIVGEDVRYYVVDLTGRLART